jgi:diaminohydroxyphosphoribosylaminopyrimidine deaminase/5-amino-6-(5-phosphoribosylamino)uracil reductase
MNTIDELWMARALELAERGRGHVEPNPLVGAVVVRGDKIVGEGWHAKFGEAHAEVNALLAASTAASGATLYVTLEPCCHHGKTPPCTDAVIRSGVARVVVAMRDPFPQVAGHGMAILQAAGMAVDVGCLEARARRLNAPYLKLLARGRPYVHAKWAMTLDGKIATRAGDSKWISGEASRRKGHELRGRMDAIIVGIGTVLADDPLLTARPPGPRVATRVVLDSRFRLPLDCQLVRTVKDAPVYVAGSNGATLGGIALDNRGCEMVRFGTDARGRPSVPDLLADLGKRRMTNVLVEGGAAVLGSFRDAGEIDEVHAFLAPILAGGRGAKSPMAGEGVAKIGEALRLTEWTCERIGEDLYWHGYR